MIRHEQVCYIHLVLQVSILNEGPTHVIVIYIRYTHKKSEVIVHPRTVYEVPEGE
jgi:hypothetical protein